MGRQRYLLSAAAVGALVVLLAYAFVVRGLGLNHGLRSVYVIVAAVLLIGSRRLVRGIDVSERPRGVWLVGTFLGGAAIAGAAAMLADPPLALRQLSTKRLPGFTVDLPDGRVETGARTYSMGLYTVDVDAKHGVTVGWQGGDGGRDELETIATGVKAALPGGAKGSKLITVADRDTVAIDVDDGRTVLLTIVPCDGRGIYILSLGLPENVHGRVVRSVVCTPEPHDDDDIPIALDLRGFVLVENKNGHVTYDRGDKARLVAITLPAVQNAGAFRTTVSPILANQGLTDVQLEPQGEDQFAFTATGAGGAGSGVIRNVRCGTRSVLVIGFALDPAAAPALASSISGAHCR